MIPRGVWTLALAACLAVVALWPAGGARADDCPAPPMVDLALRLRRGLGADSVFGLSEREVRGVFFPVTQQRALPADFGPDDLVRSSVGYAPQGAMSVRRLIVPELEALFAAGRADGVVLGIVS